MSSRDRSASPRHPGFSRPRAPKPPRRLSNKAFSDWLDSLDPPAASISTLDGFVAALVAGPSVPDPKAWVPHAFGAHAGNTSAMAAAARQTLRERYTAIADQLATRPSAYAPIVLRDNDGTILVDDWADGFFVGMNYDLPAWQPFILEHDSAAAMAMTALLIHSPRAHEAFNYTPLVPPHLATDITDAWRHIPELVATVHDACATARSTSVA